MYRIKSFETYAELNWKEKQIKEKIRKNRHIQRIRDKLVKERKKN